MGKTMLNKELLDKFADAQHEIWSDWMNFVFTEGGWDQADGTFKIKSSKVERWKRQMETPYEELSDKEKETDKQVVIDYLKDAIIATIEEAVKTSLNAFDEEFVLVEKEGWDEIQKELEKIESYVEEK